MKNRLVRVLGAAAAVVLAAFQPAMGQGVNIDFEIASAAGGPGSGVPSNTFGAAANQPGAWNRIFQNIAVSPLLGLNAAASGVTMTRTSNALGHGAFDNANTTGDHAQLFDDFWNLDNVPATVEFSGVDAGWYEVYTYAINPAGNALTRVTVNGAQPLAQQQSGGVMPVNGFLLNRTHTVHRIQVTGAGTIVVQIMAGAGSATAIGGFQIKPVDPCPDVDILFPDNFACICEEEDVKGDVLISPPGTIAFWMLQYRALNDLNWSLINFGFNSGANLNLGTFDTTGLTHGYYFLKLSAYGGDGCFDEDTHIVFVDKQFDNLNLTAPTTGQAYGKTVCIGGTLNDTCLRYYTVMWAPLPAAAPFTDVNPGMPFYFANIYNAVTFATWDTIGQAIPDGSYRILVDAIDQCGHEKKESVDIIVDNTLPDAIITSPGNCEYVGCGLVPIKGTACDTNLASWVVQVTGGPYNNWVTIASGNTCVVDDLLAVWDTTGLPLCGYTIRLIVSDSSIQNCNGALVNQSEYQVSVNVGLRGDVNGDGVVDFTDITQVLFYWGSACP